MQKILIVEDEEIMMNLLQKKLSEEEYKIETAKNGEDALIQMKRNKPDLVLLDIIMPKVGGFEVMEQMSQDPELSDIPVIIVSNSGQPVELSRAKKLGAKDWLIKTDFEPKEVIDKVKKQLG
jgi:CheY-like chemotaxis protein